MCTVVGTGIIDVRYWRGAPMGALPTAMAVTGFGGTTQ